MIAKFLSGLLLSAIVAGSALAEDLPPRAVPLMPVLVKEYQDVWKDIDHPDVVSGLIEQETCITLKHPFCWNPKAVLDTSREYGFGLGMFTKTSAFNTFDELRQADKVLRNWQWSDRFNVDYQIRGVLVKIKGDYFYLDRVVGNDDTWKFALSAYNGGRGYVLKDIKMCKATRGCNYKIWYDNVENTSTRSKMKWKGYGQSAFDINRSYVHKIWDVRRQKYCNYLNDNFNEDINCDD